MGPMIFCCEIGSNHKGQEALAFEMIRQFSEAGATICKFQLGHKPQDPIRHVDHIADKLNAWCEYFEVEFMASIWTSSALDLARRLNMKRYKIAHQMKDTDLIDAMLSDKKETFVSGHRDWHSENVRHIYAIEEYPAYPRSYDIPSKFAEGHWYGYSDHTHGIAMPLLAIARGAKFVEVHCTLDKTEESIRDNHFACTPDEFEMLVKLGTQIARMV